MKLAREFRRCTCVVCPIHVPGEPCFLVADSTDPFCGMCKEWQAVRELAHRITLLDKDLVRRTRTLLMEAKTLGISMPDTTGVGVGTAAAQANVWGMQREGSKPRLKSGAVPDRLPSRGGSRDQARTGNRLGA